MARGRKPLPKDYEKLIAEINDKIARYTKRIEEFETEKEELMQGRKQKELETLYNTMLSTGKTVEEIVTLVHDSSKKSK